MVVIGDVVITGTIHKLLGLGVDHLIGYLADQKQWQTSMKSELRRLEDALPRIQAVVDAAEIGQLEMTGSLRDWLRQLKDALYDAEDVLDELDYPRLQRLAEEESLTALKIVKRAFKSDPTLKALRAAVKRLDGVAADVGEFMQLLSAVDVQRSRLGEVAADNRESGSLPTENRLFGRDLQRKELLAWLMAKTDGKNTSFASVVGHGGMGKTALVQSVFGDGEIQSHFDLRIWVCVSNSFDVKALTRKMLESDTGKRLAAESLAVLQEALRKRLMSSGRALVVLDDAWNDNDLSDWEKLLAPLNLGSPNGSKVLLKVLLTTRMQTVADAVEMALSQSIGELPVRFQLTGLPERDLLPLFNWHAFRGTDPEDHKKLQSIGIRIAARLGGLPLAAKVVGRMLNSQLSEEYWETILNNSISNFEEGERGVMSVLRLSYRHLSKHLRPCFAYCSVFPQDHAFEKNRLVQMWMAAGLVRQSAKNPSEAPEETGGRYFDDLVKRSFFDRTDSYRSGKREWYTMHDLLHELAESVSGGECFRLEGDTFATKISRSVRHLYIKTYDVDHLNVLAASGNLENLRTLHLEFYGESSADELWRKILNSVKRMRVLHIAGCIAIPNEINKVKHLRFLSVGTTTLNLPVLRNYNLSSPTRVRDQGRR